MNIGDINIEKSLLLAPMEDVTDLPFRVICKRQGADIVYSEFIASEGIVRDSARSKQKMEIADEERPCGIQLFGHDVENMVKSAKVVEASGADFIDINYGCWVKKVVNRNAGAALLKDPDKMAEMTRRVVESVDIPVTVKTRLGWSKEEIIILKAAPMLEQAGAKAIAVHCRTRDQGMKGTADWNWIPKIKEVVDIPVILNGDVITPEDTKRAFETTGCDAVMIGRGAIGNPFLFRRSKEYLQSGELPPEPSAEERIQVCIDHLELSLEYKGFPRGLYEFRKHYGGYLKGLFNASSVRQKLVVAGSFDECSRLLQDYLEYLVREDRV